MRRLCLVWLCIPVFLMLGEGADAGWSQAGAIFLTIYPGARPVGMGGAFCGLADDALATYYNPGGLGFQHSFDLSLNHANWLPGLYPGMYFDYASVLIPVGRSITVAPAFTYLTTGERVATDIYGNEIARFRPYDLAAGINCGLSLFEIFGIGAGVKYIHSYLFPDRIAEELYGLPGGTARSYALDFGTLARLPLARDRGLVRVGVALQNLGPSISYLDSVAGDPLPTSLRFGWSYTLTLRDVMAMMGKPAEFQGFPTWLSDWLVNNSRISLTGEVNAPLVGLSSARDLLEDSWESFGIEFAPLAVVAIRGGYFRDEDGHRTGFTWGAGIDLKFLQFDIGSDADIYEFPTDNWRLELGLNIGAPFLPWL